jgi:Transcriptional regulators
LRDQLPSRWRVVREFFDRGDAGIAEVYTRLGIEGVRPRFSMALIFLEAGPRSIRDLAREVAVTHSAMSQTVTAMRTAGLVESSPGADARSRIVSLTDAGRSLVPRLRAEWDATEAAVTELEAEVPYPLTRVIADLNAALDRRSFADRIAAHLDAAHLDIADPGAAAGR